MKINKNFTFDLYIFTLIFCVISLISVFLRFPSPDFDFYNYHNYIGYAFFNNRIDIDFMPANYHTYLNPYVDALIYWLFSKLNNHPYWFLILTSLDNSIFLFMIYKISKYMLKITHKLRYVLLGIIYISFTPILLDSINFSMNDVFVGSFILISFYLLIKNLFTESENRNKLIFLAGIFIGIGTGLKLTNLFYCLTAFLSILFMYKKVPNPFKTLAYFTLGGMVSFFIVDGYWLYTIYTRFKSPIFPYFNNFFNSPYYDSMNINTIVYNNTVPRNLFEFIFYPCLYSRFYIFGNYHLDWDPRYAINFVCVILLCLKLLFKKSIKYIRREHLWFLILFITISFYINTYLSGVYRFVIPSSSLYGLVLIITILNFFPKRKSIPIFVLFIIFSYINNTYDSEYTLRINEPYNKLIEIRTDESFEDNSKVIFLDNGLSYLVPELNQTSQYYGFVIPEHLFYKYEKELNSTNDLYFNNRIWFSKYLEKRLTDIVRDKENRIYLILQYTENLPYYEMFLRRYSNGERKVENCHYMKRLDGMVKYLLKPMVCEYNLNS